MGSSYQSIILQLAAIKCRHSSVDKLSEGGVVLGDLAASAEVHKRKQQTTTGFKEMEFNRWVVSALVLCLVAILGFAG